MTRDYTDKMRDMSDMTERYKRLPKTVAFERLNCDCNPIRFGTVMQAGCKRNARACPTIAIRKLKLLGISRRIGHAVYFRSAIII